MVTKQETLLGRGALAETSRVREPKKIALPPGCQSCGVMVMGFVFGSYLASHSDQGSFLVVHALLSHGGF